MSRWKAASIHLLISFFVIGMIASYIIYFWYPPALMHMAKADRLLMLIGGVDLVVGPILTLIVYKAGKRHLKMDLAIIAAIQVSFLIYGLNSLYLSRPVFLVAVKDRFELVFANEISDKHLAEAKSNNFKKLGLGKPILVGVAVPTDPKEREAILLSAVSGQGDIQTMPQYFVDYSRVANDLLLNAKPLKKQGSLGELDAKAMQKAARAYGRNPDEVRYLVLASSRNFAVMLVDARTAAIVGPVAVDAY